MFTGEHGVRCVAYEDCFAVGETRDGAAVGEVVDFYFGGFSGSGLCEVCALYEGR